jgi:hypothetical protein
MPRLHPERLPPKKLPTEKLKSLQTARIRLKKDAPIVTGKTGLITRENISRVIERWSVRKKRPIASFDKLIRDPKEPERFHTIPATEITRRLAQKELLKSIKNIPLAERQLKIIQELLDHRRQKINGTDINLRPDYSLLMMELVNGIGEKKTLKILDTINKRAVAIQTLSANEIKKGGQTSDIFINIPGAVNGLKMRFEMDMENKNAFVGRLNEFINQRRGDIHQLTQSNLESKERHIKVLRVQLKTAVMERVKFQMKNNLLL